VVDKRKVDPAATHIPLHTTVPPLQSVLPVSLSVEQQKAEATIGLPVPDTVPVHLPLGLSLQLDSFMLGHSEVPWSQVD
jgi:hypothetical protein